MLPFKLGFSVVLLVSGLASAAILAWNRPKPIKLDLDADYEPLEGGSDTTQRDPFDILEPEDTIDGHPIEPEKFWRSVRRTKSVLYGSVSVSFNSQN